jgi:hypothetical protein
MGPLSDPAVTLYKDQRAGPCPLAAVIQNLPDRSGVATSVAFVTRSIEQSFCNLT